VATEADTPTKEENKSRGGADGEQIMKGKQKMRAVKMVVKEGEGH